MPEPEGLVNRGHALAASQPMPPSILKSPNRPDKRRKFTHKAVRFANVDSSNLELQRRQLVRPSGNTPNAGASAYIAWPLAVAARAAHRDDTSAWANIMDIDWSLVATTLSKKRRATKYDENGDPVTLQTAQNVNWDQWRNAMKAEWAAHQKNGTFRVVMRSDLPPNGSIISSKWVWKRKTLGNGSHRFKARLVIRGFMQQAGIDYDSTYAPTTSMTSLRVLLAVAVYHGWAIWNIDFVTAFLNGLVEEDIYMEYAEGLEEIDPSLPPSKNAVLKLIKALYGLKQSPRIWWKVINYFLITLGFHCCIDCDVNLYTMHSNGRFVAILLFVDDLLLVGDLDLIKDVIKALNHEFELHDLGEPDLFLGIQLRRHKDGLFLHQEWYIQKLLERFDMTSASPVKTPLPKNTVLAEDPDEFLLDPETATLYRAIVGALMFLMICTRPDIAFALSRLSKFSAKPGKSHLAAAKYTLRYIKGTRTYGILYTRPSLVLQKFPLDGFSDSAFADDIGNRRSTSAFIFVLNGAAVAWKSKQQTLVTRSTHDAEYVGLANASYEISWLRRLVASLLPNIEGPTSLYGDNQSAISTAYSTIDSVSSPRSKHIDIRFHIIREAIHRGDIRLTYVRTDSMVADALTKALPWPEHHRHMNAMGLRNGSDL